MHAHSEPQKNAPIQGAAMSVVLHAALFIFLFARHELFPSSKPLEIQPTLRVDLVGLPDLMKNEMPQSLPSKPEEVETPEPAKRQAEAPPVPTPGEMVIPDKDKKKTAEQPKTEKPIDRKTQIAQTLKRLKALEKLKDSEEKAEKEEGPTTVIKGNKVSPGNSLSGEAKEALEVGYYEKVKDALTENWSLPVHLAKMDLSAQVVVYVDGRGNLQSMKFLKSSGNALFDTNVTKTIRDSLPLPFPPKNLADLVSSKGIVLGFPL